MPRKAKEQKIDPSTFRVIIEHIPCRWSTVNFQTKDDALNYAHELSSVKVAWYGVYEINPKRDYLISVENKRLVPHNDKVVIIPKEESKESKPHRQKQRKK